MTEYESEDDSSGASCPKCGEQFGNESWVTRHFQTEHDGGIDEYRERGYDHPCPWDGCGRAFTSRKGLSLHHVQAHGESIAGFVYECDWCGNEYERHQRSEERSRFCGRDCYMQWYSENKTGENNHRWSGGADEYECDNCGVVFERHNCSIQTSGRTFCSTECASDWKVRAYAGSSNPNWGGGGVKVECSWCGSLLERNTYRVERSEEHFCDPQCHGEWTSANLIGKRANRWEGGAWTKVVRHGV